MDFALVEIEKIKVGKESFDAVSLVDLLKQATKTMKPFGMDMGEFHILISVQTCLLAGLGGTGSRKWLNLQFPIDNCMV
eukprot:scaffold40890_cov62-Attheya_sp.AAC.3